MTGKKEYPPVFIKPGEIKRLNASDGSMEFVGVYDDRVVAFLAAFHDWAALRESRLRPTNATMEYAEKKMVRLWNALPPNTLKKVFEKLNPGDIWIPEGGGDNVG